MNYLLFDGVSRNNLLPFTYTRPVADIRIGITTIREKWESYLAAKTYTLTQAHLQEKYPAAGEKKNNILINASFLPCENLADRVRKLKPGEMIRYGDTVVAAYVERDFGELHASAYKNFHYEGDLIHISRLWDIFSYNGQVIESDFDRLTAGRTSQALPEGVHAINSGRIFIEEGAKIYPGVVINASQGAVYIGKNTVVMEGSAIRGPFALCENSQLKMGAKIYGATTIGPYSKVGGEVNNSVFFGYSNKAHDGFLGNSVIGEWCNLGAGTNNSNLKNNYAEVKLWSYETKGFENTGLQFCGLMMGDHSKAGINTMFNTGTVTGVSSNIYGANFPRNFIPSFSWGGAAGFREYRLDKALETAATVMLRRNVELTPADKKILEHVFEISKKFR